MDKIKICKNCQKEFETTRNTRKNVFCGHSCSATYNNQVREPHRLVHENKIEKKDLIPLSKFLPDNWKDFYYG